MLRFKSLTSKFIFISLLMLAFLGIYIYSEFNFTRHIRDEATRINLAGQLRYRSFEMVWMAHNIIMEIKTPELRESLLSEIEYKIDMFEKITDGFKNGSEELGISPIEQKEGLIILNRFTNRWNKDLKPMLLKMLELPDKEAMALLDKYDFMIQGYVDEIDSFVQWLEDDYKKEVKEHDRFRISAVAIFVVVSVFIIIFVRRSILKPVVRLRDTTSEIEKGNFNVRIDVKGKDEIGELSQSFNQMAQTLDATFDEKTKLLKRLNALHEISKDVLSEFNIDSLLKRIADNARQLMDSKYAVIAILNKEEKYEYFVPSGIEEQVYGELMKRHGLPAGKGLLGYLLKEGEPVRVDDISKHPASIGFPEGHPAIKTFLGVPVTLHDKVIGRLYFGEKVEGEKFTQEDEDLAISFAATVAMAINNAKIMEAIHRSEASLAEAQRIVHLGDWDWDIVNNELRWSDEIYRIFGLTPQEFSATYEAFLNSVHPDDREFVKKSVDKALYEKEPYSIDHRVVLPDGAERIVHEQAEVIFDEAGKPVRMIGTVQDITERKQMEESRAESEEKYRSLVEYTTDAIIGLDLDTNIISWNKGAEEMLGYKREEVIEKPQSLLVPKEFSDSCQKNFWIATVEGYVKETETVRKAKDGKIIPVEMTLTALNDDKGEHIGYVSILRDITRRKWAEEELKEYREELLALADSSNVISAVPLTEDVYEAICNIAIKNFDLKMVWLGLIDEGRSYDVKPVAQAGFEEGYLSSVKITWDDSPTGMGPTGMAIKTKASRVMNVNDIDTDPAYAPWRAEALKRGYRSSIAVPLINSEANVIGVLNLYSSEPQFFTKRRVHLFNLLGNYAAVAIENRLLIEGLEEKVKERTKELEEARLQAEAASRAKSEFLTNMSHELRTPLNAIIGFSGLIADGRAGRVSKQQKEYLNDILDSGKHLLSLINDILDIAKIEAGRTELELSDFNLRELLEGSLEMFKEKAIKHRIKMNVEIDDGIGDVTADERKLKQVMMNLLSNAFKFTPDGGSVRVRARLVKSSELGVRRNKDKKEIRE